jgi:hypothetical protein
LKPEAVIFLVGLTLYMCKENNTGLPFTEFGFNIYPSLTPWFFSWVHGFFICIASETNEIKQVISMLVATSEQWLAL